VKTIEEIFALIGASAQPLPPANAPLASSQGLVLAEPLIASADQPPFDRSSIDGFAVRADAQPGKFQIAGSILPGETAPPTPAAGTALRIATGAEVPENCALVMLEDSRSTESETELLTPPSPELIRKKASAIRAGETLLPAGTIIQAGETALLASEGISEPLVHPRPRIAHITTGSEIVPFAESPPPGSIRNTNSPMLRALIESAGAAAPHHSHVDESREALAAAIEAATPFDILLVSGGASVGRHDHTRAAFESLGFEILAHGVNLKPGKPLILAKKNSTLAFGIPGNPASHFAVFHLFIRRAIDLLMGKTPAAFAVATLEPGAPIAPERRETFRPARCRIVSGKLQASALPWIDSGDVSCLRGANALIRIKPNTPPPQTGSQIELLPCADSATPFF